MQIELARLTEARQTKSQVSLGDQLAVIKGNAGYGIQLGERLVGFSGEQVLSVALQVRDGALNIELQNPAGQDIGSIRIPSVSALKDQSDALNQLGVKFSPKETSELANLMKLSLSTGPSKADLVLMLDEISHLAPVMESKMTLDAGDIFPSLTNKVKTLLKVMPMEIQRYVVESNLAKLRGEEASFDLISKMDLRRFTQLARFISGRIPFDNKVMAEVVELAAAPPANPPRLPAKIDPEAMVELGRQMKRHDIQVGQTAAKLPAAMVAHVVEHYHLEIPKFSAAESFDDLNRDFQVDKRVRASQTAQVNKHPLETRFLQTLDAARYAELADFLQDPVARVPSSEVRAGAQHFLEHPPKRPPDVPLTRINDHNLKALVKQLARSSPEVLQRPVPPLPHPGGATPQRDQIVQQLLTQVDTAKHRELADFLQGPPRASIPSAVVDSGRFVLEQSASGPTANPLVRVTPANLALLTDVLEEVAPPPPPAPPVAPSPAGLASQERIVQQLDTLHLRNLSQYLQSQVPSPPPQDVISEAVHHAKLAQVPPPKIPLPKINVDNLRQIVASIEPSLPQAGRLQNAAQVAAFKSGVVTDALLTRLEPATVPSVAAYLTAPPDGDAAPPAAVIKSAAEALRNLPQELPEQGLKRVNAEHLRALTKALMGEYPELPREVQTQPPPKTPLPATPSPLPERLMLRADRAQTPALSRYLESSASGLPSSDVLSEARALLEKLASGQPPQPSLDRQPIAGANPENLKALTQRLELELPRLTEALSRPVAPSSAPTQTADASQLAKQLMTLAPEQRQAVYVLEQLDPNANPNLVKYFQGDFALDRMPREMVRELQQVMHSPATAKPAVGLARLDWSKFEELTQYLKQNPVPPEPEHFLPNNPRLRAAVSYLAQPVEAAQETTAQPQLKQLLQVFSALRDEQRAALFAAERITSKETPALDAFLKAPEAKPLTEAQVTELRQLLRRPSSAVPLPEQEPSAPVDPQKLQRLVAQVRKELPQMAANADLPNNHQLQESVARFARNDLDLAPGGEVKPEKLARLFNALNREQKTALMMLAEPAVEPDIQDYFRAREPAARLPQDVLKELSGMLEKGRFSRGSEGLPQVDLERLRQLTSKLRQLDLPEAKDYVPQRASVDAAMRAAARQHLEPHAIASAKDTSQLFNKLPPEVRQALFVLDHVDPQNEPAAFDYFKGGRGSERIPKDVQQALQRHLARMPDAEQQATFSGRPSTSSVGHQATELSTRPPQSPTGEVFGGQPKTVEVPQGEQPPVKVTTEGQARAEAAPRPATADPDSAARAAQETRSARGPADAAAQTAAKIPPDQAGEPIELPPEMKAASDSRQRSIAELLQDRLRQAGSLPGMHRSEAQAMPLGLPFETQPREKPAPPQGGDVPPPPEHRDPRRPETAAQETKEKPEAEPRRKDQPDRADRTDLQKEAQHAQERVEVSQPKVSPHQFPQHEARVVVPPPQSIATATEAPTVSPPVLKPEFAIDPERFAQLADWLAKMKASGRFPGQETSSSFNPSELANRLANLQTIRLDEIAALLPKLSEPQRAALFVMEHLDQHRFKELFEFLRGTSPEPEMSGRALDNLREFLAQPDFKPNVNRQTSFDVTRFFKLAQWFSQAGSPHEPLGYMPKDPNLMASLLQSEEGKPDVATQVQQRETFERRWQNQFRTSPPSDPQQAAEFLNQNLHRVPTAKRAPLVDAFLRHHLNHFERLAVMDQVWHTENVVARTLDGDMPFSDGVRNTLKGLRQLKQLLEHRAEIPKDWHLHREGTPAQKEAAQAEAEADPRPDLHRKVTKGSEGFQRYLHADRLMPERSMDMAFRMEQLSWAQKLEPLLQRIETHRHHNQAKLVQALQRSRQVLNDISRFMMAGDDHEWSLQSKSALTPKKLMQFKALREQILQGRQPNLDSLFEPPFMRSEFGDGTEKVQAREMKRLEPHLREAVSRGQAKPDELLDQMLQMLQSQPEAASREATGGKLQQFMETMRDFNQFQNLNHQPFYMALPLRMFGLDSEMELAYFRLPRRKKDKSRFMVAIHLDFEDWGHLRIDAVKDREKLLATFWVESHRMFKRLAPQVANLERRLFQVGLAQAKINIRQEPQQATRSVREMCEPTDDKQFDFKV